MGCGDFGEQGRQERQGMDFQVALHALTRMSSFICLAYRVSEQNFIWNKAFIMIINKMK